MHNIYNHNNKVSEYLAYKGIKWRFSPPRSPHFGGLWEAAVKSFKHHFYRVIGEKLFTYEQLITYTTEIEAILNSRPLTPLSSDPNDFQALTPGHFLIGDSLLSTPEQDLTTTRINRLSDWQHIQYMKQHFWQRWSKEYLNLLNTRPKWQQNQTSKIEVGKLVLLKEENSRPLRWPLGRIVETFPGKDGIVRVINAETNSGVYKRCIKSVAPLPID